MAPKGTEITAYVNGDIPLDPAKFQPKSPESGAGPSQTSPQEAAVSSIEVKSTPDGADITVDDKFMGNTPSTLKLASGDHKIRVEKSGFKAWEKTLTVSVGETLSITATLEPQ